MAVKERGEKEHKNKKRNVIDREEQGVEWMNEWSKQRQVSIREWVRLWRRQETKMALASALWAYYVAREGKDRRSQTRDFRATLSVFRPDIYWSMSWIVTLLNNPFPYTYTPYQKNYNLLLKVCYYYSVTIKSDKSTSLRGTWCTNICFHLALSGSNMYSAMLAIC